MSAEQQQSQPDGDDQNMGYDSQRRGSVELHEDDTSNYGQSNGTGATSNGSTKKLTKSASNSPKRLGNPGVLGATFGSKGQNSTLLLSNLSSTGKIGGVKGMTADDLGDNPRRKGKHRRVATDTHNGGNDSQSNAEFLKELNKELTREEQAHMKKKSNELKYERELQHALVKLAELEEHRNTAVEIIGNLERENDDLKQESDRLRSELQNALTEIQILEKSYKAMQDSYTQDKRDFEESAKEQEMKLRELQQDITEKDLALREAEQQQRQNEQLIRMASLNSDNDGSTIAMGISTEKEKKLYEKYHNEKRKVIEKDQKIEQLLLKLEGVARLEAQNHQLMDELDRTKEEAQDALMNQALSQKAMESELIALASRNSQFQKEKEELQRLLEASEMESQQLRMHVDRQRTMTARGNNPFGGNSNLGGMGSGNDLEAQMGGNYIGYDDEADYEDDGYYDDEQQQQAPAEQEFTEVKQEVTVKEAKKEKEVPDVVKEYLHLTASAVKIKHPKVTTIDSEQLIRQVSQFSFWEYHDHMVRIMKMEEKKLETKQKEEEERKKLQRMQEKQNQQSASHNTSIIGKFRSFFGGNSNANNTGANRHNSMATKNKNGGMATSTRPKSHSTNQSPNKGSKAGAAPSASNKSASKNGSKSVKDDKTDKTDSNSNENNKDNSNKDSKSGVVSDASSDGKTNKENTSNNSEASDNNNNSKDSKDNNSKSLEAAKKRKSRSKSPAPMENIEKGFSKITEKMGFHGPSPADKDMELMAQQSFKSIQPIGAPSEDEDDDNKAVL